jgi:hypothetical protein
MLLLLALVEALFAMRCDGSFVQAVFAVVSLGRA